MDGEALSSAEVTYRARNRVWKIFFFLVIVLFLLQITAVASLIAVVIARGIGEIGELLVVPLTDEEQGVLIRIGDLVEDSADIHEDLHKWRGRHGVVHLRSRGWSERDRGTVRVHCEVQVAPGIQGAQESYRTLEYNEEALRYVDPERRLVTTAESDLFAWGEESTILTFSDDHRPAGIYFLARRGRKVFLLVVSGQKLDDPHLLEMLLRPVLLKLERYER